MARTGEVLNLVRLGKVETVTELAKSMGLARSTVNERLDILQQIGLLTTGGETSPGRGRPASLLAFNAAAGVTLVAQVGMSGTMLAITDLDAEILWRTQVQFDVSHGPDALIELICTVFGDAWRNSKFPPTRCTASDWDCPAMSRSPRLRRRTGRGAVALG